MLLRAFRSLLRVIRIKRDPIAYARRIGVTVGSGCDFLNLSQDAFGSEPYLIHIGARVTLSGPVRFLTHDGAVRVVRKDLPGVDVVGAINIGDDVFIGPQVIVLPGVTIGQSSVVGAGSVVTKDVPPGTVVAGNPAGVIKTVADYRQTVAAKGIPTHGMTRQEKRAFLSARFGTPTARRSTGS